MWTSLLRKEDLEKAVAKSILKECITCHSSAIDASDKIESSSFNGWSRFMSCRECGLEWKQLFFRGNFEMEKFHE